MMKTLPNVGSNRCAVWEFSYFGNKIVILLVTRLHLQYHKEVLVVLLLSLGWVCLEIFVSIGNYQSPTPPSLHTLGPCASNSPRAALFRNLRSSLRSCFANFFKYFFFIFGVMSSTFVGYDILSTWPGGRSDISTCIGGSKLRRAFLAILL